MARNVATGRDRQRQDRTPPITIVGAGSTGCALALLLSRYGIRTTLLERRAEILNHPAATILNARSQEIWHRALPELAARVAALAPDAEEVGMIRWHTDMSTPKLGEINLLEDADRVKRVMGHSRFLISHVGQQRLMAVLWDAVDADPLVDFRRGVQVDRVTSTTAGASVRAVTGRGAPEEISSRFVIAADGSNSVVREGLGIAMRGPVLANMASVFFKSKIHQDGTRPLISFIFSPVFCGILVAHADDDYVLMAPYLSNKQKVATDGPAYWERLLPKVIGRDEPFQIHSTGTWAMTSQTAETFVRGNVLLAGDAAHRFPHTGGFGLNSGVQDAHNLAWKLAAVVEGRASVALLDSYEPERRPVVERFAEQSVRNYFQMDAVTDGLISGGRELVGITKAFAHPVVERLPAPVVGVVADGMMKLGMRPTSKLLGDSASARARRAGVKRRIPLQSQEFVSTGLEFGYVYSGGRIASESTPQPIEGDGVMEYRPTTWPGARMPHSWLAADDGGEPVSTHDRLDLRDYTLFTADPAGWRAAVTEAMPVAVVGLDPATPADRDRLLNLFEVGEHGAVLVRPDGHVAWRTSASASVAADALGETITRLACPPRGSAVEEVTA